MKKFCLTFGTMLLLGVTTLPMSAQVSNDNEDGVVKMNADLSRYNYVQGQVLVKFKDESTVEVRRKGRRFASTNVSKLTNVLQKYDAEEMEQLLPQAKVSKSNRRKAHAYNGDTIEESDLSQLYLVTLGDGHAQDTELMIADLKELDEVEYAEPNYLFHVLADSHIADSYQGNPMVSQQWYLDNYGVKELWTKPVINKERPVIAIIDTGVDLTHPDLKDNLWTNTAEAEGEANYDNDSNGFAGDIHGWDFINNTPNIRDNNMHGTHVAGIAAAVNNATGIVGANPQALIMPVTVMQSDGTGDVATIVKGIDYAVRNGATVLNLSLGSYSNSSALRQSLERAYQTAVIVAAAGNDNVRIHIEIPDVCKKHMCEYGKCFPAAYSFVLGVQATTDTGELALFSNHDLNGPTFSSESSVQDPDGFNYELKAPGTNILSTIPGGKYKVLQGTSMAAPLVAGAISALKMVKKYDSQEVLWGDLLHSDNIAGAYAITKRPAELDIMKVQLQKRRDLSEETEDDYVGSYEIKAGDTVSVYPVIRTTFGEASNIKLQLEMGDDFEDSNTVQILTGTANFGWHLDAYGKNVSANPLVMKVANNVSDARHIKMKVIATCDESTQRFELPFTMVIVNRVMISGLISEDKTLTADHVYYVNENLGIMKGATLTIEPGTHIEFSEGMGLASFGKLVAKGTPEKPIVFARHTGEGPWIGLKSHQSEDEIEVGYDLYTNADSTLFTLKKTEQTPNKIHYILEMFIYSKNYLPRKDFYLSDYMDVKSDMTAYQDKLTDAEYLTPAILKLLKDWREYYSQFPHSKSNNLIAEYPYSTQTTADLSSSWRIYNNPRDTISYCRIEGYEQLDGYGPHMIDCVLKPIRPNQADVLSGLRNNITDMNGWGLLSRYGKALKYSNIVNNIQESNAQQVGQYSNLSYNNYFNNFCLNTGGGKYEKKYSLAIRSEMPTVDHSDNPPYVGTGREDIVRPYIWELGNAPDTYGIVDLSNMRKEPYSEAHGIVWKVCVNGKDAQDEFDDLAPLGVGRHKFEVYFNRPMNKAVEPQISFGVRDPYTQQGVAEDGSWNDEGTIYTAYKTINGKTKSDGKNRIYVHGAEDNEYFECPYEKTRFNINVQAAGSMATGFTAEAGLGRVNLTWNNEQNNFDDAMGFNIYRYAYVEKDSLDAWGNTTGVTVTVADTVRINQNIVDIETTHYTDYDVVPGETYYYMYKVLSTDLQEYDVSNVVAATPQTSTLGDANGDTRVDVTDVMTTVNVALGMDQKPFIFEAADVNTDKLINVLDVIGIVQMVLHPDAARVNMLERPEVVYIVEDGVLYVETPVAIGGFQVQLALDTPCDIMPAETLNGFEVASSWLTDSDYRLMVYSCGGKTLPAGKHAVLTVGEAGITSLCFSDGTGRELARKAGSMTAIEGMASGRMTRTEGVFNLNGQKVAGKSSDLKELSRGVYIVNGEKVLK